MTENQRYQNLRRHSSSSSLIRRYNFFKDVIGKAFENDSNLSQDDKLKGMLVVPGDAEYEDDDEEQSSSSRKKQQLTETQRKWQQLSATPKLENTVVEMDFYLTGVPNKDPSNDLFGSKVNVSSRDRQVGLAVPDRATVSSIKIEFLQTDQDGTGKCRCLTDTAFTADDVGDYRISDDGKQVRFRIQQKGYTRTIETKGTINKIYWSNEKDESRETSTTYSIEAGWIYGEADVSANAKGGVQLTNGVLKIERAMGLLGAASKMTPCGKFDARAVTSAKRQ